MILRSIPDFSTTRRCSPFLRGRRVECLSLCYALLASTENRSCRNPDFSGTLGTTGRVSCSSPFGGLFCTSRYRLHQRSLRSPENQSCLKACLHQIDNERRKPVWNVGNSYQERDSY